MQKPSQLILFNRKSIKTNALGYFKKIIFAKATDNCPNRSDELTIICSWQQRLRNTIAFFSHNIDCKVPGIGAMHLKPEFVKKY